MLRMHRVTFFLVFFLFGFASVAPAFAYKSPGKPNGYVNDFAGVFSSEQKSALEQKVSSYVQSSGNELSVVTIKSLDGDSVENYANRLFIEWGIGKKGKDNGLLFLVAIDEHKMRMEVGYGLEPYLTDLQTFWIQENVAKPLFKQNKYYEGVDGVMDKAISALSGTETIPSQAQTQSLNLWNTSEYLIFGFWILFSFFAPLLSWIASLFGRSKSWWAGGVVGGILGLIVWLFVGSFFIFPLLLVIGFFFDYIISKNYKKAGKTAWWAGGNRSHWDSWGSSGGGGSFGGFGGGSSGGGGSSSSW
ncbi:MAG: TPM domain-containing protein [bacterium]